MPQPVPAAALQVLPPGAQALSAAARAYNLQPRHRGVRPLPPAGAAGASGRAGGCGDAGGGGGRVRRAVRVGVRHHSSSSVCVLRKPIHETRPTTMKMTIDMAEARPKSWFPRENAIL